MGNITCSALQRQKKKMTDIVMYKKIRNRNLYSMCAVQSYLIRRTDYVN